MDVFMEDMPAKSFNSNITTFPKNKLLADLLRWLSPLAFYELQWVYKMCMYPDHIIVGENFSHDRSHLFPLQYSFHWLSENILPHLSISAQECHRYWRVPEGSWSISDQRHRQCHVPNGLRQGRTIRQGERARKFRLCDGVWESASLKKWKSSVQDFFRKTVWGATGDALQFTAVGSVRVAVLIAIWQGLRSTLNFCSTLSTKIWLLEGCFKSR